MPVHHERVGRRRVAAGRRVAAPAARRSAARVPVVRVVRPRQVDEAGRRRRPARRTRLAAECVARREAARAAEQAVRVARVGVAAAVRRAALVQQVVEDPPDVAQRHRAHLHAAAARTARQKHTDTRRSPHSITERRVPAPIPVLGSQPAGDVSHKPGGRLPLLSARPAVTVATVKRAASNFAVR